MPGEPDTEGQETVYMGIKKMKICQYNLLLSEHVLFLFFYLRICDCIGEKTENITSRNLMENLSSQL